MTNLNKAAFTDDALDRKKLAEGIEIAEETDSNLNTVLGRMRYALINLRKMIDEKNLVL